jgi:hypothetical protein
MIASLACVRTARADDVDDFVFGVSAYLNADYAVAVARLEPLVADDPPRLRPDLVEAARRYLAASQLATSNEWGARRQMEAILRANPDATFNVRDFSPLTVALFARVRAAVAERIQAARTDAQRRAAAEEARRARQRAMILQLASVERVGLVTPRWAMFIPFGIGQFVNGDVGMGVLFATVPTLALGGAVGGFVLAQNCPFSDHEQPAAWCAGPANALFIGGIVGAAVTLGTGIVHANLTYRVDRTELRRRPVPPELRSLRLAVTPAPGGASGWLVGAAFRF